MIEEIKEDGIFKKTQPRIVVLKRFFTISFERNTT